MTDAETERLLAKLTIEIDRLRASHDRLLAAAKIVALVGEDEGQSGDVRSCFGRLRAAIAAAEEMKL